MIEPAWPDGIDPPPETPDELYDHAPCGYLTTRADGTIVRINETLLGLLGETRGALLGRPVHTILTADARDFFETHCQPLLERHGALADTSIDLRCASGTSLPVRLTWHRVADAKGHVLGYRVMVVNAIERVAYEQALQNERDRAREQEAMVRELTADMERLVAARSADLVQAQKMESLGQLTGGIAHDFNNLLTPILISLDVLHRRYLTDERALRMASSAISAAERGRVLIARLLAFARRQHLRPQAVNLAGLVAASMDMITETIGPLVTLRISLADCLPPARVDPNQLEAALLNLCINARDAMPEGGVLTIAGDEITLKVKNDGDVSPGRYVRLAVIDTGPGMNADTLRRAAEPFFSTKSVGKGTGLGLSMVYGLAAQSGGKLALESAPGHGTSATIWLPVDQAAAPANPPAVASSQDPSLAPSGRPLSILLVDDDELVRFATGEMLADLGHTVVPAHSGPAALEAMRQHEAFDLLVTDYLMPGMTGVELARVARLSQPGLPGLLITGYANIRDVDSGGLQRLAKPFGTNELSKAIAEVLSVGLVSAK